MSRNSLSIIIPIYNEVNTLRELTRLVFSSPISLKKEVILVDAGSNDGSTALIHELSRQYPLKTLFLDQRTGKGLAVREGLRIATGRIIMIQDGDLEYDPSDYPALLSPILNGESEIVLGSRRLGAQKWNFRSHKRRKPYLYFLDVGDFLLTKLFCFLYRVKMSDPLTMFKVFQRHHVELLDFYCNGFDFDWEILCKLINTGYSYKEVPVTYHPRTLKEGKKLRALQEGFNALKVILKLRFPLNFSPSNSPLTIPKE